MFIEQCGIAAGNHLQALCLNRSRVQRRLRRGMVDWERMSVHAHNADCSAELVKYLNSAKSGWKMNVHEDIPGPCMVCQLVVSSYYACMHTPAVC
jgi:hypothetical protein